MTFNLGAALDADRRHRVRMRPIAPTPPPKLKHRRSHRVRFCRLRSRKDRQKFERRPDRTFTRAELVARGQRRIAFVKQSQSARFASAKKATRALVCVELGVAYSPRTFRRWMRALNGRQGRVRRVPRHTPGVTVFDEIEQWQGSHLTQGVSP